MEYKTRNDAIKSSIEFIEKVKKLEKEYGFRFNSDTEDIYLNYKDKTNKREKIDIGWNGNGIKVMDKKFLKGQALAKLTKEEIELLNINI